MCYNLIMSKSQTEEESNPDIIDEERRKALVGLAGGVAAVCMALALVQPTRVLAASGDDDDDDDDDHGDDDDDHEGGDTGGRGTLQTPPEAPYQERRRGSRKARRERRWRWLTARREKCEDPQQLLLRIRTCSQGL